ncbi:MAG TPA: GGDEF domain-containing protein [Candidatus Limnocylindrales bacterium]|nr:GGDEF domain-containing protein [Candidatus Limnocylindrales bacterium]
MSSDGPSRDPRAGLPAAIAAVTGTDDADAALAAILEAAAQTLTPSLAAIVLSDPDRPGLTLGASYGLADPAALMADLDTLGHPFAEAAAGRAGVFDREAVGPAGPTIGAYLPLLIVTGGVQTSLGALGMVWPAPHVISTEERETLTSLAALGALAVDRARLTSTAAERSEWFERMAHSDPLTGLANERTIGRILELELARTGRQGGELSLALFDVDDFRATNEQGGHEVGDDVLRRVAAVLAESVRLVDTVGRIGGDEFVLVAPGAAGAMVARRVLDGIAALPAAAGRTVSVSAGVARFPSDGADSEALIAAATAALARAKGAGAGSVAETEAVAEG